MSFESVPHEMAIHTSGGNGHISMSLNQNYQECPTKIKDYLMKCGWTAGNIDPNTSEPLFSKYIGDTHGDFCEGMYYRWYEALSIEFYFMMTIGGHDK